MEIDERRQTLLDFIIRYKQEHNGCAPSTRQMMTGANLSSTSMVHTSLKMLERAGKIRVYQENGKALSCAIEVVGSAWWSSQQMREMLDVQIEISETVDRIAR